MAGLQRPLKERVRRDLTQEAGFSLVEVVVAMGLLMVVALATASGLLAAEKGTRTSRERSAAANLAAARVEHLRSLDVRQAPSQPEAPATQLNGTTYTTTTSVQAMVGASGADPCSSAGSGADAYYLATVRVSWGAKSVTTRTRLTPRGGTGATSSIKVRVRDRNNAPRNNVPVKLTPITPAGSPVNASTTGVGCHVFTGLTNGVFSVSVTETTGVGVNGANTYTQDVSVDNRHPPPLLQFGYDEAGTLALSFAAASSYVQPLTLPGIKVVNPGMQPNGYGESTNGTKGSLFPFAAGYQAWLGLCPDADPAAHGGTRSVFAIGPGATVTGTVAGGRVTATVRYNTYAGNSGNVQGTVAYANVVVSAHNQSSGCTGLTNPYTGVTGIRGQVLDLGTTNANGQLSAMLPFGLWQLFVKDKIDPTLYATETTGQLQVTPSGTDRTASIVLKNP